MLCVNVLQMSRFVIVFSLRSVLFCELYFYLWFYRSMSLWWMTRLLRCLVRVVMMELARDWVFSYVKTDFFLSFYWCYLFLLVMVNLKSDSDTALILMFRCYCMRSASRCWFYRFFPASSLLLDIASSPPDEKKKSHTKLNCNAKKDHTLTKLNSNLNYPPPKKKWTQSQEVVPIRSSYECMKYNNK